MFKDISLQALGAGFAAAFVGFAGSFAIVLQGLIGVGATPAQAATGLAAVTIAMGLCGIFVSLKTKMPISIAWSTPGAAFLATLAPTAGGFNEAVGAFIIAATLFIGCAWIRPLRRALEAIPTPLAAAMLAGVLFPLCLAPIEAMINAPHLTLPVVLVWLVVSRLWRAMAAPAAVLAVAALIHFHLPVAPLDTALLWTQPTPIVPQFTIAATVGIALPLFIITMAGQNITGIAVLRGLGYRPNAGALFGWSGAFGLLAAPFGAHAVNLAAITAAMCAGEDAHADAKRRYWAAVASGAAYVAFGLSAGAVVAFISRSPQLLIATVAALALLGALAAAMQSFLTARTGREAALITFIITATNFTVYDIGGVFWGLLIGGMIYWWDNRRAQRKHRITARAEGESQIAHQNQTPNSNQNSNQIQHQTEPRIDSRDPRQ